MSQNVRRGGENGFRTLVENQMYIATSTVTIANGESLSTALSLAPGTRQLAAIQMPAAWTDASLTFAVSADGTTYSPLYFAGSEYTVEAAGGAVASGGIALEPRVFAAWPYVKIRSGTAASAVNQGAARTLTVLTRAV
jgi:hypothetical protein